MALRNIPVGAEGEGVDSISMVQGVEVLAIIEVPQHGLGILAAGSTEGTVRGHSDSVQVAKNLCPNCKKNSSLKHIFL